jgi:hypothetical protein
MTGVLAVLDGQRLGDGEPVVHGDDLAVHQDHVRAIAGRSARFPGLGAGLRASRHRNGQRHQSN